jgi:hypothetical protein
MFSLFKADIKRARASGTSTASTTSSFFARAFSDPTSRHDDMCKLIEKLIILDLIWIFS